MRILPELNIDKAIFLKKCNIVIHNWLVQKRVHIQVVDPGSSTTDIQSPTLSTTSSSKTPGHKRTLSDEIPLIMDSMLTDATHYVQQVRNRTQVLSLDNPLASLFVTDKESHVSLLFRALQSSLPKVNSDAAIKAFMDGIESELGFDPWLNLTGCKRSCQISSPHVRTTACPPHRFGPISSAMPLPPSFPC